MGDMSSPWIRCPYCEGEYHRDNEHGVRECIAEVISDHRFALTDSGDYAETAADIVDVLKRRGPTVDSVLAYLEDSATVPALAVFNVMTWREVAEEIVAAINSQSAEDEPVS